MLSVAMHSTGAPRARAKGVGKMRSTYSVDDLILNYDPEHPPERFREAGLERARPAASPGLFRGRRATRRRRHRSRNLRRRATTSAAFAATMPS